MTTCVHQKQEERENNERGKTVRREGKKGERGREGERHTQKERERDRERRTRRKDRAGFRQRILRIKPQCSVWQLLFLSQRA